jgi:hypothetical protein
VRRVRAHTPGCGGSQETLSKAKKAAGKPEKKLTVAQAIAGRRLPTVTRRAYLPPSRVFSTLTGLG